MATPYTMAGLIATADVKSYFHESVRSAMANQSLEAQEETTAYVVNLLAGYTRTDQLFGWSAEEGYDLKPLALLLGDAVQTDNIKQRHLILRRLGDVALFVSGLFSDSLRRKLVDVDYYCSMGGSAYGYLSESVHGSAAGVEGEVFGELSRQFNHFVHVLEEVGDHTQVANDADLIRWYDLWTRTGSSRAARLLSRFGVHIQDPIDARLRH